MIHNMIGGGGTKLFAAIGVTYPAGSTLTCTNGTTTLKAKTTTGQWVFAIPKAGTWTVTSTDGTNTKSQSVSITSEGQSVNVVLSYVTYIYNKGDLCTSMSGGWVQSPSNASTSNYWDCVDGGTRTFQKNSDHIFIKALSGNQTLMTSSFRSSKSINLTNHSILRVRHSNAAGSLVVSGYSGTTNLPLYSAEIQGWADISKDRLEIDISKINKSLYIVVGCIAYNASGSATSQAKITTIELD